MTSAGVKPTGDDCVKFQAARDKKGSAEVKDVATERGLTDVDVKMNDLPPRGPTRPVLAAAIEAVPKTAAAKDADRWKMIATAVPEGRYSASRGTRR